MDFNGSLVGYLESPFYECDVIGMVCCHILVTFQPKILGYSEINLG